jgi:hypothetical protein
VPVIVIELFLVLGAVLAFAIWQFRDLARERRLRDERQRPAEPQPADSVSSPTEDGHAR